MIGLVCLRKMILTKQVVQASELFVITSSFLRKVLDFWKKYGMVVII